MKKDKYNILTYLNSFFQERVELGVTSSEFFSNVKKSLRKLDEDNQMKYCFMLDRAKRFKMNCECYYIDVDEVVKIFDRKYTLLSKKYRDDIEKDLVEYKVFRQDDYVRQNSYSTAFK